MTTTAAEAALDQIERNGFHAFKTNPKRRGRSRRVAVDLVGIADSLAVIVAGMVPATAYAAIDGSTIDWAKHLQICLITALIVYGCLKSFGMYDTSRLHELPVRPEKLLVSLGLAFFAILGLGLPITTRNASMWHWYMIWLSVGFVLLTGVRTSARLLLRRLTVAGIFDTCVAVYGSGAIARRVHDHLADTRLGIRFVGLFDDRTDAARRDPLAPVIVGSLDDLACKARAGELDRIIIALPQTAEDRTRQIARRLEHLPVSLHVVTHLASDLIEAGPAHTVSSIGSVGLIDVKSKPLADWSRIVKATEDYLLATIFLIAQTPLLALIAIAIRLDSKGPVLFHQRRRGINRQVFEVLKFRTMHVLEDGDDLKQATRNDPRVTRVGRVLRWLSLDELPQLWNVLRGEMSLVGPRPHALAHDDRFGDTVERYANRHQVKPGITGLAQISGFRGETETPYKIERRVALDLQYVDTWSLWLDLKILALTTIFGFYSKNAY